MSLGSITLTLQLSSRCRPLPPRTCSTSINSHCMTATWSSFTFLVRFGDINLAIDAACFTTDPGLNPCVTACQTWKPSPGLTLRILTTSVATSPRLPQLHSFVGHPRNSSPKLQPCCLRTCPICNFSQQRTTLSIARQLYSPASETQKSP